MTFEERILDELREIKRHLGLLGDRQEIERLAAEEKAALPRRRRRECDYAQRLIEQQPARRAD